MFAQKQNKGILLHAEMGFGKSAIMRQVLCAKNGDNGERLRNHVVAFHICKFDVPSTWKVERFIRRLIGFFSTQSAEYGGGIALLNKHSLIFDMESCAKEPIACLDQGVISPLKGLKSDKLWIIAIDALDECFNPEDNKNSILYLLRSRIRAFPSWISFLISSRDMYEKHDLKQLERLPLNSSDVRNIKDIEEYLEEQYLYRENLKELLGKTEREEFKENVLKQSEGNFLFIRYALEYVMSRTREKNVTLPAKLANIYEINFQRKFPSPKDFEVARGILQIVCASINPLNRADITEIMIANGIAHVGAVQEALINLTFFLNQGNIVRIIHQSLREWLTAQDNSWFYISIENGHKLLSNYLIESLSANKSIDFVELVIHVAHSKNDQVLKIFRSLKKDFVKSSSVSLHELIWRTDSAAALELMLSFTRDVETLNDGGASPAFIAAARGHTEQLKVLFKNGANCNFIIKAEYLTLNTSDIFVIHDLIKNKFFTGYGLLHIATKFKHLDTVQLILKTNQSLINVESTAGYYASDIACESGHLRILRAFLVINESFAGERCVYLAAKNGHEHIVDMLLRRESMRLTCITKAASLEAHNKIVIPQTKNPGIIQIKLIDDWWLFFRESPLHVAIRYGHNTIAERLVQSHPELLDCFDAFGRTPFLASVWYDKLDIFKLLSKRLSNNVEKCRNTIPAHISGFQQFFPPGFINEKQCPLGASFPHLAAIFDRIDMLFYVLKNRLQVNWTAVDTALNPPDHYAACAGSLNYLYLAKHGSLSHDIDEMRAANGSSVYHIAALCTNTLSMVVLKGEDLKDTIPNYVDDNNRSILHYSVLSRPENSSFDTQLKTIHIINTLTADGHSLTETDYLNRNFLHYMLSNGYHYIVLHIYNSFKTEWVQLIGKVDEKDYTPVTYAISYNNVFTPEVSFDCLVSISCNLLEIPVGIPLWEYAILEAIILDNGTNVYIPSNFFLRLFNLNPHLTKALLMHLKPNDNDLKRELLHQLDNPTGILGGFRFSVVALYVHKPHIFHVCGDDLSRSPLHKMALNIQHSDGLFSHHADFVKKIVKNVNTKDFKKYISCSDKNGYNVFHYSLIGGNTPTAEMLLSYNILVKNSRVHFEDILWMTLLSRNRNGGYHTVNAIDNVTGIWHQLKVSQICSTDNFLEMFINKYKSHFLKSVFCNPNRKSLSLIHLMSLNGMLKTVTLVSKLYGQTVLQCVSKDGFTPYYMWRLFNDKDEWVTLSMGRAKQTFPQRTAEDILLFKIKNDFPLEYTSKSALKCLFKLRGEKWERTSSRIRIKIMMCLSAAFTEVKSKLNVFDLETSLQISSMLPYESMLLISMRPIDGLPWLGCDSLLYNAHLVNLRGVLNLLIKLAKLNKTKLQYRLINVILRLISDLNKAFCCPLTRQVIYALKHVTYVLDHLLGNNVREIVHKLIHYIYNARKNFERSTILTVPDFFWDRCDELGFSAGLFETPNVNFDVASEYEKYNYLDIIKNSLIYKISKTAFHQSFRYPILMKKITPKNVSERKSVSPLFIE